MGGPFGHPRLRSPTAPLGVATVVDVHSYRARAKDNLLIRGDSLHALTNLLRIPEFGLLWGCAAEAQHSLG